MSPGLKSTKRYAPVPTGLRLAGASRDLPPLKGSNRCLGMIMPRTPTKASAQNGVGLGKVTLTVWLSTLSTLRSLYVPLVVQALAGSAAYSQLKTTSSAVKGLPSCHCTFFFSFQVTDLPSLATAPIC